MKKVNYLLKGSFAAIASLLLFSCKKQVTEPFTEELTTTAAVAPAMMMAPTTCKPAVFGSYGQAANNWVTLHQKWYSGDKVSNLKVMYGATGNGFPPVPFFLPLFVEWSTINYQGNQVTMMQHPQNHPLMRVTLNAQGLPEASYYHNDVFAGRYYKDTTYFFYTGTRLDSMISLSEVRFFEQEPSGFSTTKYIFMYDAQGNLTTVDMPALAPVPGHDGERITYKYDLSIPVSGIMFNHNISIPLRLLEAMELIQIPMHHAVTEFKYVTYQNGPGNTESVDVIWTDHFSDYNISPEGLVQSYVLKTSSNKYTYYSGWDCGGSMITRKTTASQQEGITSLDQFRQEFGQK